MIYLAFDHFTHSNAPICGQQWSEGNWDREWAIGRLLQAHPTRFALAETSKLLEAGVRFAYILGWRHYFDYDSPPVAERQAQRIRQKFAWLLDRPELLNALRVNKAKLVLIDWFEGEIDLPHSRLPGNDYKFQVLAELLNIPIKAIVFVHGNANAEKVNCETSPNYVFENIFELMAYGDAWNCVNQQGRIGEHPLDKPLRFLSYARHWNEYRQCLTIEYFVRGLDKYGLISCGDSLVPKHREDELRNTLANWATDAAELERLRAFAPEFLAKIPITLDYDLSKNLVTNITYDHYLQTDLSVVNETYCNDRTVFATEKIFKTMWLKHPFLMMGNPGMLSHLRDLGYKTFWPYLDESYDDERHLPTRKNKLLRVLTDFCNLSREHRLELRQNLDVVAEHNYQHFIKVHQRNTFGKNLIKFLSDNFEREYLGAV